MADEKQPDKGGDAKKPEKSAANSLQRCLSQPSPQELILSATTLSLILAEGRTRYELETLINLLSLTTRNLQSALTQVLINEKTPDILDVLI